MGAFAASPAYDTSHLINNYDWERLEYAHIVDIGGSQGHVAVDISRQFPKLRFTVQDMSQVIAGAEARLPQDLAARIKFMKHDLMEPQKIHADVFLFRWVLHNWPDDDAVKSELHARKMSKALWALVTAHNSDPIVRSKSSASSDSSDERRNTNHHQRDLHARARNCSSVAREEFEVCSR